MCPSGGMRTWRTEISGIKVKSGWKRSFVFYHIIAVPELVPLWYLTSSHQRGTWWKHDSRTLCSWDWPATCVFWNDGGENKSTQWFLQVHRLVCVSLSYSYDICRNFIFSFPVHKNEPKPIFKTFDPYPSLSCQMVLEISMPFLSIHQLEKWMEK